ncbi:mechanosensitive ion channel family protein [Roseateles sp.]|jgi:small-conductance mechanosensitive channel|uniref:mechanosensitive ion channel family protein n=1 Tax=Roseateles sp. TaxID=1971397 RepID=UPI0037C91B12
MNHSLTFEEFLQLGNTLLRPSALIELALALACLGLAWLLVWRLRGHQERPLSVLFGTHVIDGALFPLLALLLAWLALRGLPLLGVKPAVFKLVIPVLVSLAVIRLTVRVLSAALPNSGWMRLVERTVSWLAWGGSVLWITGLLHELLKEMESITWKIGGSRVSLLALLEGGMNAVLVMVAVLWISAAIEARLLRNVTTDLSLRKIGVNLTRSLLLFVGLLISLTAAGIDLTALGVLGGAMGVGIGLGLQKLAANYVSGFVILAERSLRIGDMVLVDGFEGRISDIKTRYTVIRALNGREAVVPNEMLITQRVENASLADARVLVSTTVQVAYGTDLDLLMPMIVAVVARVPRVQSEPEPAVQLRAFGADGLELNIAFWVEDAAMGVAGVRSDVNLAVLRLFNERGVVIPYPQRVLHHAAGMTGGA